MTRMTSTRRYGRYGARTRLLGSPAALVMAAGTLALLYPGGLGEPGPVRVTDGASAAVFRSLNGAVAGLPSGTGTVLDLSADVLLLVLGLLLVRTALRHRDAGTTAGVFLTGLAMVAAYAVSEALKLVVDEERPCRAVPGAEVVAACPEPGDWSFPSNHATLAAALATGLALLRPRCAVLVLLLGAAVAVARVAAGVHYPHDVLAGAALGAAAALASVLLATPPVARTAAVLLARFGGRGDDARLMGHHGRGRPVVDGQPGEDGADMRLDRSLHQPQPAGDLPVGESAAEEGQHLPLPGRERLDPATRGGPAPGPRSGVTGREMGDHPGRDLR